MNILLANTTNHRRTIMFVAAAVLGVIIVLVLYQAPFAIRVPIESGAMGLLIFEIMFRTRKWLSLKTLILYAVSATVISQFLYSILYGDFSFQGLSGMFSGFPYNLYALLEMSIVTGLAYYLIKFYRNETWAIPESSADASNEPIYDEVPLTVNSWLRKNQQQIIGFVGWYVLSAVIWIPMSGDSDGIFINILVFPITLLLLIVLGLIKKARKLAQGILLALAANFVLALFVGMFYNGICFVPFYLDLNL